MEKTNVLGTIKHTWHSLFNPAEQVLPSSDDSDKHQTAIDQLMEKSLPNFIRRQIVLRLSVVCLSMTVIAIIHTNLILGVYDKNDLGQFETGFYDQIIITSAVLIFLTSMIVFALLRLQQRSAMEHIIVLGLVYEVIIAFFMSLTDYSIPGGPGYQADGKITWVYLWITIYPLIVPCSPKKTIIAAACSSAMVMVAMLFATMVFQNPMPSSTAIYLTLEGLVMVSFFASLTAYIIHQSNLAINKERHHSSYQLESLLGEGNMGKVWQAKHKMLHRPAAIKIIDMDKISSHPKVQQEYILRFEREAQSTASLYSPHSISLYDFGITEDGSFFYVMEALHGIDLQQLVKQFGPLPAERVVYLLLQICESLAEAHQKGLVHRDIKPANIFVCHYGIEYDFVKVLDFGMVKSQNEITTHSSSTTIKNISPELTQAGNVYGTPAYMAPEMLRRMPVDHRYDMYSLGCVAYWMLSGKRAFLAKDMQDLVKKQLYNPPIPFRHRTNNPVPEKLEQVIFWCLAKNPDERPKDMLELIHAIKGVEINREWTGTKMTAWWQQNLPEL